MATTAKPKCGSQRNGTLQDTKNNKKENKTIATWAKPKFESSKLLIGTRTMVMAKDTKKTEK